MNEPAAAPDLETVVDGFKGLRHADRVRFMRAIAADVPPKLWFELQNASVQRLDYAGAEILLHVTSHAENIRLRACAKEPFTIEWIQSRVGGDDVLYDVGANVGVYSLVAAKNAAAGRVFAFEPSLPNLAALAANIVLNDAGSRIVPMPFALSDATALSVFSLRSPEPGAARHMLGEGESPEGPTIYPQPVVTYRLDDLIDDFNLPPPNHIKLDVDGGETAVLAGAERTLRMPTLHTVLVELSTTGSEAAAEMLERAGLHLEAKVDIQNKAGEYLVWYGLFSRDPRPGSVHRQIRARDTIAR